MFKVIIKGKYSELIIEYPSFEQACAGKERALNKIAFSKSRIEVIHAS